MHSAGKKGCMFAACDCSRSPGCLSLSTTHNRSYSTQHGIEPSTQVHSCVPAFMHACMLCLAALTHTDPGSSTWRRRTDCGSDYCCPLPRHFLSCGHHLRPTLTVVASDTCHSYVFPHSRHSLLSACIPPPLLLCHLYTSDTCNCVLC